MAGLTQRLQSRAQPGFQKHLEAPLGWEPLPRSLTQLWTGFSSLFVVVWRTPSFLALWTLNRAAYNIVVIGFHHSQQEKAREGMQDGNHSLVAWCQKLVKNIEIWWVKKRVATNLHTLTPMGGGSEIALSYSFLRITNPEVQLLCPVHAQGKKIRQGHECQS